MEVTKGNKLNEKRLYHIQAVNEWHDDPYDTFVWSDHRPTAEEVSKLYKDEWTDLSEGQLKDYLDSYNIYTVYAEEV